MVIYCSTNKRNSRANFWNKVFSSLFGIVFLSHQIGAFFGSYLGGYFYDLYGSYDYAWFVAIALSIFATCSFADRRKTN